MTLFIKDLDENGKPKKEAPAECQECGYKTSSWQGLRVHMAVHRNGPDSYHQKGDLYKSRRWTYET